MLAVMPRCHSVLPVGAQGAQERRKGAYVSMLSLAAPHFIQKLKGPFVAKF